MIPAANRDSRFTKRALRLSRVYPITDAANSAGLSHLELVRRFLAGGARLIQVREKRLPDRTFFKELTRIREIATQGEAQLILNDRVDMALAIGADGVHLGQEDLPVEVARRLLGAHAIIGISTHNLEQFEQACRLDVDYIAVGPIFVSSTKPGAHPSLGCRFLEAVRRSGPTPIVAIGGITLESAPQVWRSGAASVAVISDIVNHRDPALRIQQYLIEAEGLRA